MFDQIMHLKMVQQEVIEKNLSIEQQVAQLHANVDKAWYQLRQKNMYTANFQRSYLADNIKILKNGKWVDESEECWHSKKGCNKVRIWQVERKCEIHRNQLKLKDVTRITDQISSIKWLQSKITVLEKSEAIRTRTFAKRSLTISCKINIVVLTF